MTEVKKTKKVLKIVGNVLMWIFIVFCILVTALVFAAQGSEDGVPSVFGKSLVTISTDSMEPTYDAGDLVFMDKLSDEEKASLKVGDIITYRAPVDIDGDNVIGDINTHRIVSIDADTGAIKTQGDNKKTNPVADSYVLTKNDIIGTTTDGTVLPGFGNVINFLSEPLGFFLCIVLPLILFFIYQLYRFIALILAERAKNKPVSKETEEEIKRKAIEEYLKAQEEAKAEAEAENTQEASATETEEISQNEQ